MYSVCTVVIVKVVNDYRVPKPDAVSYRYTEVVRKQDLRRKMDGFACFQCQQVPTLQMYIVARCNFFLYDNWQIWTDFNSAFMVAFRYETVGKLE